MYAKTIYVFGRHFFALYCKWKTISAGNIICSSILEEKRQSVESMPSTSGNFSPKSLTITNYYNTIINIQIPIRIQTRKYSQYKGTRRCD